MRASLPPPVRASPAGVFTHISDRGDNVEASERCNIALIVLDQPAAPCCPRQGPCYHPAPRQQHEAQFGFGELDDAVIDLGPSHNQGEQVAEGVHGPYAPSSLACAWLHNEPARVPLSSVDRKVRLSKMAAVGSAASAGRKAQQGA